MISVDGVLDAGFYNGAVSPTIAIDEANPGTSYITSGGQPFVSGATFGEDGSYQIQVYVSDLAGNESQLVIQFDIDQLAPVVEVLGVADGEVYASEVTPTINISDSNLQFQQVRLNNNPYNSGTTIDKEGEYFLEAVASDAAGNTTRVEAHFRIDRSAPSILISGVADGEYYDSDVTAIIDIEDAGAFDSTITLNSESYVSGTPIRAEGNYQLSVNATDAADNSNNASVAFVIDKSAPEVVIEGVTDDGYYASAAPSISVDDANLDRLEITLDGVNYESLTPILDEGDRVLRVFASDLAGNEANIEVFFTIDSTPPQVIVDTPLHGETLLTRNTDVVGRTEPFAQIELEVGQLRYGTNANAAGEFAFNGVVLERGLNTLYLNAVDRAQNAGPITEVSVQVVSGSVPGEYRAPGGVLIWAPLEHDNCKSVKSKKSKKSEKSKKTKKSKKSKKSSKYGDCHVHAPGEMFGHEGDPALGVIESALMRSARDFQVVHREEEFLEALRSQRFGIMLLLDWHKDHCGKYDPNCDDGGYPHGDLKPYKDTLHEVRAEVARGAGLVLIKTRPDQDKHWEELTGVRVKGSLKDVYAIDLLDAAPDTADFGYDGRAVRLEAGEAAVLALSMPQGEAVMTLNDYADGHAAVLGFNPAAGHDAEQAAELLDEILEQVTPSTTELVIDGVVELAWLAEGVGEDTTIELQVILPPGMHFIDATDATLAENRDQATWRRVFNSDNNRFAALVRLPSAAAVLEVEATLSSVEGEQVIVLNTSLLELDIKDDFEIARDELVDSIAIISATYRGQSGKSIDSAIAKVEKRLAEAFAVDPATGSADELEEAIESLLDVIYELEKKDLSSEAVTQQIGDVLRYYQSAWYQQTTNHGVDDAN